MADPTIALQVQTPGVNGAANFAQGAAAKSDLDTAHLNQANASIGLMGQVALGAMNGDINGQADPAKWAQGQALLKAHGIDMSKYGPDAAPMLAHASISTLGQLQQVQNQQQFERTMAAFANQMKQQDFSNNIESQKLAMEQQKVNYETNPGTFKGDSMDAQSMNILMRGDRGSPAYAAAYNQMTQPKTQFVQGPNGLVPVQVTPTLPAGVLPPLSVVDQGATGAGPAPATPSPTGAPPPSQPGSPPPGVTIGEPLAGNGQRPTEQQMRNIELTNVVKPEVANLKDAWGALAAIKDQGLDKIPGIGNFFTSEGFQRGKASLKTIVASYLYSVSGATANPGEVENQTDVLTPKPGDKPQVIADKWARIQNMIQSMNMAATPNGQLPGGSASPSGTSDPLGIR